jgi:hypothetical protein
MVFPTVIIGHTDRNAFVLRVTRDERRPVVMASEVGVFIFQQKTSCSRTFAPGKMFIDTTRPTLTTRN